MASSSLITSIHSALTRIKFADGVYTKRSLLLYGNDLKIGLRNLNVLLLLSGLIKCEHPGCLNVLRPCLRNVDNDVDDANLMKSTSSALESLLSRIELVVEELVHDEKIDAESMSKKLHSIGKDLDDELSIGICQSSSLLSVDEAVSITDYVLYNATNFVSLVANKYFRKQTDAFEVIDAFAVHVRFMKNVLMFGGRGDLDLQNVLMPHIQPIVINAARAFIMDVDVSRDEVYKEWCKETRSKCLEVNGMATDSRVYQAYSHALCISRLSSTPLHMGDDMLTNLLGSLISLLWDSLRCALDSNVKNKFKVLYERLRFLRALIKKHAASLDESETIRVQIVPLICDAGVLICSFHQVDHGCLSELLQRFDVFRSQVVALEASSSMSNDESGFGDATAIQISDGYENVLEIQKQISTQMPGHQLPQSSVPHFSGYHSNEVTAVLDRLIRGSEQLRVVPICGMAGLGKTTFALKLYNHPSVLHHFRARAWCPVSQDLDKKKVLLHLYNQIKPGYHSDMTEENLANKLRQGLKGRRYLILLDDVWSPEVLNNLKESFPDDITGSRIILTSRCVDIAPRHLPYEHPYLLRLRADDECVEILKTKLFHKAGWTPDLGMEVAKICKGLPLTLVIVSGLLATTEQEGWKAILDNLSSGCIVSGAEQCNIALELGYMHLPDYLRPCFLYFGAFPEDEEVSAKRLIRLWMAEGFVMENDLKRTEDVGLEYMEKLIERSLIMVVQNRSVGGVKTCRIHDLLHSFCRSKAKQENLFHLLQQSHDQLSDFNEPPNLHRLSIHSTARYFKESGLFCPGAYSLTAFAGEFGKTSRLFDMSFIIQIFQRLKVLNMAGISLINGIPEEIKLLTQLRYFSFYTPCPFIPLSIGELSNLEFFIAFFFRRDNVSFPHTLWNLHKLKYLHIKSSGDGFTLPVKNLENSSSLLELETLRGVVFYSDSSMKKQMQKFPCIRRLKCTILPSKQTGSNDVLVLDVPSQLQSLSICVRGRVICQLGSTVKNVRKLKLDGSKFPWKDRKFPNLEVLKLSNQYFEDFTLAMKRENFPELRYLKLYSCNDLKRWTASDDDELPSLETLKFINCGKVKEIPSWLETSSVLEEILVDKCSSALESLVRHIEEVRQDYGNLVKLHIISNSK